MLTLLTIPAIPGHTYKRNPKYLISQWEMEGQQEPLLETHTSTDLELVALDNLQYSQPSASTSTASPA